jgi:NAD-dependent deacetylase
MVSQVQAQKCDVLLVVGTSLQVFPAAQIPITVKLKHPPAKVIEVNREPSALHNRVTDVMVMGSAAEIMSKLMEHLEAKVAAKAS